MDRSFSVKDFSLFSFLVVLMVIMLLSMYMIDRQWSKMAQMQRLMDEQAKDLRQMQGMVRNIEQRLRKGQIAVAAEPQQTATPDNVTPDAFRRAVLAAGQDDYQEGDWYVQAIATGLKTITPLVSQDVYSSNIQSYILESLLVRDSDTLEWAGLIAKDWQIHEDGLTFTFNLREDVRFSDGTPLEAKDVAFSYQFIMDERIAAPRSRAYFEKIESVTAIDQFTVEFKYKEPYFNALSLAGSMSILAKHFYEPYLEKAEEFNQSKGLLLGSGPYRLPDPKGWTPSQGMVEINRNPRYWGTVQPSFDRILWKVIENDSARLTTFRNGDIDVYSARPREYQNLLEDDDLAQRTQNFEYMSPSAGYSYIGWNQNKSGEVTRFADQRVRQAMTYLTDRRRIIDEIMLGYGEVAISPFNPRSKQHDTALKPRNFDLKKAQQLLAEAGYQDTNGDGIIEDQSGVPFEFELVYFQGSEDTKRIVLFLKDLYASAGILMKPKPTEWSVMLDLLGKRNFDAISLGWSSGIETDIYQMFHGKQVDNNGDNFIHYKNSKLDKLIDKARATVDEKARMPLWQQAENIMFEDQPYTFLMRRKTMAFIDKRMQNVAITKLGLNSSSVPVEWYVPQTQQKYAN
ncbi:Oligopeptide ABC transporter, periplasmic oligopeptide-binding protein OppA (TC 3.A.1.5.1) [hydrothermal vent metagenome]|uniref:Oligopeptide ABC transporter, periplasmic oligopeptide-binding protein OppA (TC 3.A.1.5.1) n=1 Tax=hydrothermal vent metagenome TaxID=652676 RepID=A0A3B0ZQ82_9ZZZZ